MTNRRFKILFLTRWYPPSSGTFAEKQVHAVSLYCDVIVLAVLPEEAGIKEKQYIREVNDPEHNIRVIRVFYATGRKNLGFLTKTIQFARYSAALIRGCSYVFNRNEQFDLVHVNILSRTAVPAIVLKFLKGVPYIITEHWSRYLPGNNTYKGFLRKMFTKFIVTHASAVTAVSHVLRKGMIDRGLKNKNFQVIPNTVNTDLFVPSGKPSVSGKKRILHISGFDDKVKNTSAILRIIARISQTRTDFECHFIGGREPFREQAEQYALELGILDKFVFFDGRLRNRDLAKAIQESDFLLMFSNYESFCTVIIESLSCGKPVLTSAAGGIPEFFTAGSGIMTGVGDENACLRQLHFMLDHYQDYDCHKMREYVLERFSYGVVGRQYYDLYESIIKSPPLSRYA